MIRLQILESDSREAFVKDFEKFVSNKLEANARIDLADVKFQRNLYYKGIGSSAGRTPGSTRKVSDSTLDESWIAFIPWDDAPPYDDTRFRD